MEAYFYFARGSPPPVTSERLAENVFALHAERNLTLEPYSTFELVEKLLALDFLVRHLGPGSNASIQNSKRTRQQQFWGVLGQARICECVLFDGSQFFKG